MYFILYVIAALMLAAVVLLIVLHARQGRMEKWLQEKLLDRMDDDHRELRMEVTDSVQKNVRALGALIAENQQSSFRAQGDRMSQLQRSVSDMAAQMENRLKTSSMESEQKLENIRDAMEKKLGAIQADNNVRLDEMRKLVDDKLQRTLDERMTQSFRLVNERLEQVYKGLGEMQSLAVGVGDLKRVLTNVKTRGILGEVQLSAILEDILTPDQYMVNVATSPKGRERVEFAVKLPAEDGGYVLLPIDSKFPADAYTELMDAYDSGSPERVAAASEALKARIRGFARDIRDKYIDPPYTTEFGIMFLPTEGLYAEAVKQGLVERLQKEYRISIAGPSIMAALLNSLQMGFRSVAIQKRSGEVWKVLSAVKTEFGRFEEVLTHTQRQLIKANEDLDKLIGVRTRQIRSSLRRVTEMPEGEIKYYLPLEGEDVYADISACDNNTQTEQ
ncbi:MAG: DNA recombination protein RmuC [Clostridia bacterium]|nr:DNA recombination protein RmuC [Clostridia bacterium]